MTATSQNLDMTAGDTMVLAVSVADGESAVDLSNVATIAWVLKRGPHGPALLAKSIDAGIEIIDAVAGQIEITFEPADTAAFASGPYFHGVVLIDAGGAVSTVMTGIITISPKVIPV